MVAETSIIKTTHAMDKATETTTQVAVHLGLGPAIRIRGLAATMPLHTKVKVVTGIKAKTTHQDSTDRHPT